MVGPVFRSEKDFDLQSKEIKKHQLSYREIYSSASEPTTCSTVFFLLILFSNERRVLQHRVVS
jgi:hypothetical protein